MMSKETRLSNLIANLNTFKEVYGTKSKTMDMFLGDAMIETEATNDVWSLDLVDPQDVKMIAFQSNSSLLSKENI